MIIKHFSDVSIKIIQSICLENQKNELDINNVNYLYSVAENKALESIVEKLLRLMLKLSIPDTYREIYYINLFPLIINLLSIKKESIHKLIQHVLIQFTKVIIK